MRNMIKAVFIISFFTFIDRVLGFIFKIYLSKHLGAEAIGVYQVSLSFFFVLLSLVTSGIPLVLSKLTAKYRYSNELKKESALSCAGVITSTVFSLILCVLILVFSRQIGAMFADDKSLTILLLLLPAIVFSAVYSALRGNLWGRKKYLISSALELIEQFARIILCVVFFCVGFNKLHSVAVSLTVACFVSMVICVAIYFWSGARLANPRGHFKMLIKSSAGVSASRASTSAVNGVIAVLAPYLLMLSGMSKGQAMFEFGYSVGMALPLIYIPLTVVGSLSHVMIPSLSEASANLSDLRANVNVRRQIEGAIKTSIVLGALFLPLFFALGEPIGVYIYKNTDGAMQAGAYLSRCAWLLIPISVESITSSMLNPIDMELKGFFNYLIGAGVMLVLFGAFYNRFSVDVLSIGMGIGWSISSVLNILLMRKRVGISFSFVFWVGLAVGLAVPAVYITKWSYNILDGVGAFFRIGIAGSFGILFLLVLDFLFGLIRVEYFVSGHGGVRRKGTKKASAV